MIQGEKMDKKLTSNYIYSVIYQTLIVITPFITVPYLTRVMGVEALSINDMTGNLTQWFVLFGIMGVNIYGNREIARVRDNKRELSRTFFEIFSMQFISMCLSTIAFFIFINVFKSEYNNYLIVQGITLLSVSLDITWFFYGVEDFKKASIRNMAVKILNVALILILIKGPQDLMKFIFLNASLGVFGQLVMWVQLRHYIHFEKINLKGILKHVKPNISLFIPQIAISIYSLLDISMLGLLYEEKEKVVNLYKQAQNFVKMFLFFITSIGSVMLPRISNIYAKGETEAMNRFLNKTFKLALYLAIPMIVGIFGVIESFVNWFLPLDYYEVGKMMIFTSPIILFISLSNVFGTQYLVPIGNYKHYTISVVSGALVNLTLNYIFIPDYGAYGAIFGSVMAELVVTIVQWFFVRNKLKVNIHIKELSIIIFSSLCMLIPINLVISNLTNSFISSIIQIVVGGSTYVILLYVFKAPLFMEILNRFLKRGVDNEA
jgi:O-antigen/teichoic acid export membrane protein